MLDALMLSMDLNQSDLARMTGVSRQAVSLWANTAADAPIGMRASHLMSLSRTTGISLDELAAPLPIMEAKEAEAFVADLLWDRLYPSLADFALALVRGEDKAAARLVQVFGLYRAARIAGSEIWTRFPDYRHHIQPQRRQGLEFLWRWETSLA